MKRKKHYKGNSPNRPIFKVRNKLKSKILENNQISLADLNFEKIDLSAFEAAQQNSTPRMLAAAKEFNIGKEALVEFFLKRKYEVNLSNPNTKLTFEMYVDLVKEFQPERFKQFEINATFQTLGNSELVLSIQNGRFVLKQEFSDGSIVFANGVETKDGLFFPQFSTTSNILSQLEEMINSPNISEDDLQKFLELHPELILENYYDDFIPQARIITEENSWEADFVLVPNNQTNFCKILELKLPTEKLFINPTSGHMRLAAKLNHSLQQLKDYYNAFDLPETRRRFKEKYNTEVFKPDMQLIIGRKNDAQTQNNFRDHQRSFNVKITDWDTFIDVNRKRFK